MTTQLPIKISRLRTPHCFTRSALDKNLIAIATSRKPNTTLTVLSQPPDFGIDFSQPGNNAKTAKGNASPKPKPPIPKLNCIAPPLLVRAPAKRDPRIGPVQEKETMANVSAIKKIPLKLPIPALASVRVAKSPGNLISKYPKKEIAKTTNTTKKARFNQTFVEILFKISGFVLSSK